MQLILTKRIPETATKPSRVKAWTSGNATKPLIVSYQATGLSSDQAQEYAACKLSTNLGWDDYSLASGELEDGTHVYALIAATNTIDVPARLAELERIKAGK